MIIAYSGIVLLCTYIGWCSYSRLKRRYKFYNSYIKFLDRFSQNLSFRQDSLRDIVETFIDERDEFAKILKMHFFLKDPKQLPACKLEYLSQNEIMEVKQFLNCLGNSDVFTQQDFVAKERLAISIKETETKENFKKYGAMSIKLGVLVGAFIVILLI